MSRFDELQRAAGIHVEEVNMVAQPVRHTPGVAVDIVEIELASIMVPMSGVQGE